MQRKYQLPLGYLARVLLWSNGELPTDETTEREVSQMLNLLRAKLRAVEVQLIETAAVRRARQQNGACPQESSEDGLDETDEDQGKLPWEA